MGVIHLNPLEMRDTTRPALVEDTRRLTWKEKDTATERGRRQAVAMACCCSGYFRSCCFAAAPSRQGDGSECAVN